VVTYFVVENSNYFNSPALVWFYFSIYIELRITNLKMQSVIFSYSNTSRLIKNQKNPADLGRKSGLLHILYERRLSQSTFLKINLAEKIKI
jgi:hypothetical protein